MKRFNYFLNNWKLGFHLMFRTKRFGVNNKWWESFDSLFGYSFRKKLTLLNPNKFRENLKIIHFRALACYFLVDAEVLLVYRMNRKEATIKYLKKN